MLRVETRGRVRLVMLDRPEARNAVNPELARRLRREWQSVRAALAEGIAGAARFAAGHGRGGTFEDI